MAQHGQNFTAAPPRSSSLSGPRSQEPPAARELAEHPQVQRALGAALKASYPVKGLMQEVGGVIWVDPDRPGRIETGTFPTSGPARRSSTVPISTAHSSTMAINMDDPHLAPGVRPSHPRMVLSGIYHTHPGQRDGDMNGPSRADHRNAHDRQVVSLVVDRGGHIWACGPERTAGTLGRANPQQYPEGGGRGSGAALTTVTSKPISRLRHMPPGLPNFG